MQLGHEPVNEGVPIVLDMGLLSEGVGFLYATSHDGGNTSLFLVGSAGQDVIWTSPWNPAINRSWFEANKTQLADMNYDGLDEVVLTGAYGSICLMETTGRIVWLTHVSGGFLTRPFGPLEDALVDFDGNGFPELVIGGRGFSALDPDTGHLLYQAPWNVEDTDFVVNLDEDSKYELVGHDVYVLEVFHYEGIWQDPYYPQNVEWFLLVIGLTFGSLFVVVIIWYWRSGRSAVGYERLN
jgi:hypothetical protein